MHATVLISAGALIAHNCPKYLSMCMSPLCCQQSNTHKMPHKKKRITFYCKGSVVLILCVLSNSLEEASSKPTLIKFLVSHESLLLPFTLRWSYFHWFQENQPLCPFISACISLFIEHPAWLGRISYTQPHSHDSYSWPFLFYYACRLLSVRNKISSFMLSTTPFFFLSPFPPTLFFSSHRPGLCPSFTLLNILLLQHIVWLNVGMYFGQTTAIRFLFITVISLFLFPFLLPPQLMSHHSSCCPTSHHNTPQTDSQVIKLPWQLIAAPSSSMIGILQPWWAVPSWLWLYFGRVGYMDCVIEISITTNQKQQTEWRPPQLLLVMPQGRSNLPPSPQETASGHFVAMATSRGGHLWL